MAVGDILQSQFTIANNQVALTNVNGLLFDPGVVRSVEVTYNVYRSTATVPSGNAETGKFTLVYDDNAPVNSKWSVGQQKVGEAGIVISVLDSGQFQYMSSNIAGLSYFGLMKFSAKVLGKV